MKSKKYKEALLWTVALCVPVLFLGCSREDAPQQPGVSTAPHYVKLGATIEGVAVSNTKVTITGDTGAFAWSEGDQVAVHTHEGGYVNFTLEHVDPTTGKGTFFGNQNGQARDRYAIYPASIAGTDDGNSLQVNLPDTYTIDTDNPYWKTCSPIPMVATNDEANNQLSFKYACGLFRITLSDIPEGTDRITVTAGQNICGNFTVNVSNPDTPTLSGGSSTSVTFQFKEPLSSDEVSSGIVLNLPVPASVDGTDYTSLIISVRNTNGIRTEKAMGRSSKKLVRGKGRKLAFSFLSANPADCLPGMFSVSPTKNVYFAQGNLTFESGKWSFLNNSWEYNTTPTVHGAANGSQHFIWSGRDDDVDGGVFEVKTDTGESTLKSAITHDLGAGWRGLSLDEWRYLLGYDNGNIVSSRRPVLWHYYAKIKGAAIGTGDKRYLLIFPGSFTESDWTEAMGTKPNTFDGPSEQSIAYTVDNFTAMQKAGIVILPAAGTCYYSESKTYSFSNVGKIGFYWSSTSAAIAQARRLKFESGVVAVSDNSINKTLNYFPVRLVRDIE